MNKIDMQRYDASSTLHRDAATVVSGWSKNQTAMKPIRPEDIPSYPYSALAFGTGEGLLGHVAVVSYDGDEAVVGGLVVNPACRGRGVGYRLIQHIISAAAEELPDMQRCTAFANYSSLRLFQRAGGILTGFREPVVRGGNWIIDLTEAARGSHETATRCK